MFAAIHHRGAELAQLLECAADFSPLVEETAPDTVTFDVSGLARLFGSPGELGEAIARRLPGANVAIAGNPDLAVHGARGFTGVTVMEPGREASLPLAVLAPPPDIGDTFTLWGIRTFGELAALPADGVAERLGAAGAQLHKLARGAGDRPLVPANPAPPFAASIELEHPLELLEPLSFLLGRLLNDLCAGLNSRGLATHEIHLRLALEAGAEHTRTLRLPYPMRDARTFLKLLMLDLEAHPPQAAVMGVALRFEPVNPRVVQHGLFIPLAPEPQKLELTLARIARLVGEEHVGAAELLDTHRPGAFRMKRFTPSAQSGRAGGSACPGQAKRPAPRLALRVYRPALPARVQATHGRPARVMARGIQGEVIESAGPWRSSGDWWGTDAWSRDEWDVALSDGALYRLYRGRADGEWFLEGSYD